MAVFLAVTINWVCQKWGLFFVAVLDFFGAFAIAADFGFDRSHFLTLYAP